MAAHNQIHKAQVEVLYALRRNPSLRYTDLMRAAEMESDNFKFHLRGLVKSGIVTKNDVGTYNLTAAGKEYANNLDLETRNQLKQPKLSMLIIVNKTDEHGRMFYLLQKRLRNPFWGYWGFISGPVMWGESIEDAASRELHKQTGLQATFSIRGFYRKRDYEKDKTVLLEDKLFTIIIASNSSGDITNSWGGGDNQWVSADELARLPQKFNDTDAILQQLSQPRCV